MLGERQNESCVSMRLVTPLASRHLRNLAKSGGDGVERRLAVLVGGQRSSEEAKILCAESFGDAEVGARGVDLLGSRGLVEGDHANAGVDADDLDAGVVEALARFADLPRRELRERRKVDGPAEETDLDA